MDYSMESMVFYCNDKTVYAWLDNGEWFYSEEYN